MTSYPDQPPVPFSDAIDTVIIKLGNLIAWCYVILVAVIVIQVILRKGFAHGLIALEELQWHLYAIGFMFGLSYAQVTDSHIRVDLFHERYSTRTKRIIDILGILLLALPFIYVVFDHSIDFVSNSYRINESSDSPSGLPWRWLVKSVIPLSFAMLALSLLSRVVRDIVLLSKGK